MRRFKSDPRRMTQGPHCRPTVPALLMTAALLAQPVHAQTDAARSIEDEVRDNILAQPVGDHTVADLHLPPRFLDRAVDRVIRSSYRSVTQIVVPDGADPFNWPFT